MFLRLRQLSLVNSAHSACPGWAVLGFCCALGLQFLLLSCSSCNGKPNVIVPTPHFVRGPGQRKLIIFVHGVLGDMDNTWINPTTHNSWPDLIASDPEMKDFDLYVYGYSSPMVGEASNIREIADSFGQQLKDGKIFANYDEVDFITHSMGGIITKRMLDTLNTPSESINLHRVHCVLYFAVPSNGAEIASLASWISSNPQFKSMSPRDAADFLQAVEGDWAAILRARNPQSPFPRTYSAYEKLAVANVHVVPQLYTSQLADGPVLAFDYNHIQIVKPENRDSYVYQWSKARILEASAYPVEAAAGEQVGGHVVLFDAFRDADHSGLNFSTQSVVSFFSGKADLMVSNTSPPQASALFFVQADEGGTFQNAPQDKGANGGIQKMPHSRLSDVTECPVGGYLQHWFSVEENGVYCVLCRDGHHYAKVQVSSLQTDRIAFDWLYQPAESRMFH